MTTHTIDHFQSEDPPFAPQSGKTSRSGQARINGAKSNGPTTAEGKEKTSWNTLKHGFRTDRDVIHGESHDTYNQLCEIYRTHYAPQNIVEADLVDTAISARWRARRARMMESCTFNYVMEKSETAWAAEFSSMPIAYRHTMAFHGSLKSKDHNLDIEAVSRWEERLINRWRRTILAIKTLRGKQRPVPSMEDILNAEAMLPDNCGNFPDAEEHLTPPPDPTPESAPIVKQPPPPDPVPVAPPPAAPQPQPPVPFSVVADPPPPQVFHCEVKQYCAPDPAATPDFPKLSPDTWAYLLHLLRSSASQPGWTPPRL